MSALGLFPLGTYVVLHLWTNLSSLKGAESFDQALRESRHHPAFIALELLLGLAFVLHIGFGLLLMFRWRPNRLSVEYFGNFKFLLQRVAGIGVGLFLLAHVINARIQPALTPAGFESWQGMRQALSEPVTFTVYVLALLGVSFHLANGLWTFLITWGLTVTPSSQRISQGVSLALFAVLLLMSGLSLYGFLQPTGSAYVMGR
jgi:succinate dehydrogenase / fumarate reductase cytochrome b subunit